MRSIRKVNIALVVLTFSCLSIPAAAGDQVPFFGMVTGQVISVTPQDAQHLLFVVAVSGHATHLGRFTGEAEVLQNVVDGSYTGSYTWIAANGDTISGTFEGQLIPSETPGISDNLETSIVTEGTGRFEGATGSATFGGQLNTNTLSFVYPFQGTISNIGTDN